jgi:hypothetical protein
MAPDSLVAARPAEGQFSQSCVISSFLTVVVAKTAEELYDHIVDFDSQ